MVERPVALITGASRGIGRAIAIALAQAGYDIAGVSRSLGSPKMRDELVSLEASVGASGAALLPLQADVSDLASHDGLVQEVEHRFGRIDLLVNNAGVAPRERSDLLETTPESFDRVLSINLRGAFFLSQAVARRMLHLAKTLPDYSPKIVFITSISAEVSSPNRAEYCISKAGLSMAAKIFADRLARVGVAVYEIRPGLVATDMTAPVREAYDAKIAAGLIPLGRWGQPEEIGAAVVALARGAFGYATGTVIELSGGMNIRHL